METAELQRSMLQDEFSDQNTGQLLKSGTETQSRAIYTGIYRQKQEIYT